MDFCINEVYCCPKNDSILFLLVAVSFSTESVFSQPWQPSGRVNSIHYNCHHKSNLTNSQVMHQRLTYEEHRQRKGSHSESSIMALCWECQGRVPSRRLLPGLDLGSPCAWSSCKGKKQTRLLPTHHKRWTLTKSMGAAQARRPVTLWRPRPTRSSSSVTWLRLMTRHSYSVAAACVQTGRHFEGNKLWIQKVVALTASLVRSYRVSERGLDAIKRNKKKINVTQGVCDPGESKRSLFSASTICASRQKTVPPPRRNLNLKTFILINTTSALKMTREYFKTVFTFQQFFMFI